MANLPSPWKGGRGFRARRYPRLPHRPRTLAEITGGAFTDSPSIKRMTPRARRISELPLLSTPARRRARRERMIAELRRWADGE